MTIKHKEQIIDTLNELASSCHDLARRKGFHDANARIFAVLREAIQYDYIDEGTYDGLVEWIDATAEQAEIARMHSELSEWLEGIRKPTKARDDHLPEFFSAEVEAADCIIRILDTCGKRSYRIGEALAAKLEYNAGRPYKHGKNS